MSFSEFGLSQAVVQSVYKAGYEVPTEIQKKAIPPALQGRDMMACAPTGTGKTAAFVLPMLERFVRQPAANGRRRPRALILTPTRELALQIEESVRCYGVGTNVRSVVLYGGVGMHPQIQSLGRGMDVIVATPGRLLDHLQRNTANLSAVEYLVLDEADRMFDMGFIKDVQKIVGHVPRERQTLLFAATMSSEVRSLAASVQRNPAHILVGQANTPVATVDQRFYAVATQVKMDLLVHLLKQEPAETVLVFSRTKHGADKIARKLHSHGIPTETIHSNRSQAQRERALEGFKRGRFKVLVATDIAARGIDVDGIARVVNYNTPAAPEDYIHRIGRTGRAHANGTAVTFVSDDEHAYLQRLERTIGKRFELKAYPGFSRSESPVVCGPVSLPNFHDHSHRPQFGKQSWGRGAFRRYQNR